MKLIKFVAVLLSVVLSSSAVYGHSGKTDSNGGHYDYQNKSGLGSYHYHCGGHTAHLHINEKCPYSNENNLCPEDYNLKTGENTNNRKDIYTTPETTVDTSFKGEVNKNKIKNIWWNSRVYTKSKNNERSVVYDFNSHYDFESIVKEIRNHITLLTYN